ncbi:DUF4331 family protein [Aureitalea marina]|uniref:Molecular chaperone DnaK n=1 Tax=Aureitalea marina TaxID=930804 RepID=A0A2S7KPS4_9FLAO|nr:DUF4331 family protein [Aureitalea marina]PQB04629.1 hypothetical protein BST85_06765 [Aureitalea marina]
MRKSNLFITLAVLVVAIGSLMLLSADHLDAPDIAGTSADIADLYAFEGDNANSTVFVATLQGPLTPGAVTNNAQFDEDVLIEFNIDNTGDFIEDLVIQAIKREDTMYFFGPAQPVNTGLSSEILTFAERNQVQISSTEETFIETNGNMKFFAGPRRDAFYFDFNRFNEVVGGTAAPDGFFPPEEATDFFEDLNVLAIVVEVPNAMLGTAPPHVGSAVGLEDLPPAYNVWVSAKRKE